MRMRWGGVRAGLGGGVRGVLLGGWHCSILMRWITITLPLAYPPQTPTKVSRYVEGVRRFDFDAGLAPYDFAACTRWNDLTCFMDEPLLKKLLPVRIETQVGVGGLAGSVMSV